MLGIPQHFRRTWYFVAFCQRLIYEYMDMDLWTDRRADGQKDGQFTIAIPRIYIVHRAVKT